MKNREKVLEFLKNNAGSFCDDCISKRTAVFPRATINMVCNSLAAQRQIRRSEGQCQSCLKYKFVNQIAEGGAVVLIEEARISDASKDITEVRPWYWEGNLQTKLITWLVSGGYKIRNVADTAARSRGVDIIAEDSNGEPLWISVKGYPDTTQHAQARHYFSGAIFDLILYRGNHLRFILLSDFLPDSRLMRTLRKKC